MIVHEHGVDPLESEDSFKFCGSPLSIDVEKEEINLYGVISTSIFASNILSHSGKSDADGPTTDSTGIDAASLKDSSLGSEILETLPSSADRLGHNSLQDHPQPSGGGGVGCCSKPPWRKRLSSRRPWRSGWRPAPRLTQIGYRRGS